MHARQISNTTIDLNQKMLQLDGSRSLGFLGLLTRTVGDEAEALPNRSEQLSLFVKLEVHTQRRLHSVVRGLVNVAVVCGARRFAVHMGSLAKRGTTRLVNICRARGATWRGVVGGEALSKSFV